MFFPLLQHKHLILYVLNNCEDKFICYDSRNVSKDTRQTLINHGLAFADFFKSGKIKRYWKEIPSAVGNLRKAPVQRAKCQQQADSASCGVFCCLFAEEVVQKNKLVHATDDPDQLRMYMTFQLLKRSTIVDHDLKILYSAFIE